MSHRFIKILGVFGAILITASCMQEVAPEESKVNPNLVEVTFLADVEGKTKAGFSEENYPDILWNLGDEISVIGANTGNQKFTADNAGPSTTFTGLVDPQDEVLYAVYPYDAAVAIPTAEEKIKAPEAELMRVTIPSTQIVTPGSFDPKAFVAVAKSTGSNSFTFKSAGAFLKFRFNNDGNKVRSVTVEAHGNQTISATSGVKFDSKYGTPTHGISGTWANGVNKVMLVESDECKFVNGQDYFLVIRANSCPYGITVTVEYDNGAIYTKSTDQKIFSKDVRNVIMNLGSFDKSNGFTHVSGVETLDYSYAGYKNSEEAPAEWNTLGYEVFDVTDYGAIPNDGKSDRSAFLACEEDATGQKFVESNTVLTLGHTAQANAIVYFPEGEYILHTSADDYTVDGKTYSRAIQIRAGNFIIRGAGRDKTTIVMEAPNLPTDASKLYSSPSMILLKHNSTHTKLGNDRTISGKKGSHTITVSSTEGLAVEQWVCLYIKSKDPDFTASQVAPYADDSSWQTVSVNGTNRTLNIFEDGVEVIDYHKIKSIEGNKVTFYEPLMTDVNESYGWELHDYPHYENVGVEDLTFRCYAKENFNHHGSWEDDGGYKPLILQRVTDSWVRRVEFISASEACSIINSANVSAYDIRMSGVLGHSAVRSEDSSRILIAATVDETSDKKGNFHGVGVSKHSIGTVLWRNVWGDDSCFESHANQPRATLIDCCSGGWHKGHMGGNNYEAPHHLSDLVIWNFTATKIDGGEFTWWDNGSWRFLPPVIAGFKGGVTFPTDQAKVVDPCGVESLFEYQLENRLGTLPAWLEELK